MADHPAQVGVDELPGEQLRVLLRYRHGAEDAGDQGSQRLRVDSDPVRGRSVHFTISSTGLPGGAFLSLNPAALQIGASVLRARPPMPWGKVGPPRATAYLQNGP